MTKERQFPTDAEVEEWLEAGDVIAGFAPNHIIDQAKAAHREGAERFQAGMRGQIASGAAEWGYSDSTGKPDHEQVKRVARMVMTVMRAGVQSLCDHTRMIRPLWLNCDPPIIACFECIRTGKVDLAKDGRAIGHLWDHQCDRCGVRTDKLSACTVSGFGTFTVSGHICGSCADQDRQLADRLAKGVMLVEPNRATRRKGRRG